MASGSEITILMGLPKGAAPTDLQKPIPPES
jgi:hypothetical protein